MQVFTSWIMKRWREHWVYLVGFLVVCAIGCFIAWLGQRYGF